jgi:predicted DCC family thiol-disulfide oxidoreductase YuxK
MPQPDLRERIFFDGDCGLCHWAVQWVQRHDQAGRFRFAPSSGPEFSAISAQRKRSAGISVASGLPNTLVVETKDGTLITRSRAVLYVLRAMGGRWRRLALALSLVPAPLLDFGYRAVASVRRVFGRPPVCER